VGLGRVRHPETVRLQREMGVKVNVKETLLAKIESWEQKKNIMLNKSKLKERKSERMYIDDNLTNEERKEVKRGG
jgi:hypothetical protein